jgi:hypothetical protein
MEKSQNVFFVETYLKKVANCIIPLIGHFSKQTIKSNNKSIIARVRCRGLD